MTPSAQQLFTQNTEIGLLLTETFKITSLFHVYSILGHSSHLFDYLFKLWQHIKVKCLGLNMLNFISPVLKTAQLMSPLQEWTGFIAKCGS